MKARVENVRSRTRQAFFIVPNVIIDHYLEIIKPAGFSVYCALRRHADMNLSTFVGTQKLAQECGLTQSYMRKILKLLAEVKLITVTDSNELGRPKRTYWISDNIPIPGKPNATAPLFEDIGDAITFTGQGEYIPAGGNTVPQNQPDAGTGSPIAGTGSRPYKEEQDPSNKTKNSGEEKPSPPSLHYLLSKHIQTRYQEKNGYQCPWNGRTANVIKVFLESHPVWGLTALVQCVDNRFASDRASPSENPASWIPYMDKFLAGPLDEYGKTKGLNNAKQTATDRSKDRLNRELEHGRSFFGQDN
jgi:hypothetical protein